uniref:SFRICE_035839 n=1 Tax=Spodoptera frugiperda TaxID=7108 RepID=A0A2H1WFH5_SPOFR
MKLTIGRLVLLKNESIENRSSSSAWSEKVTLTIKFYEINNWQTSIVKKRKYRKPIKFERVQ